MNVVIDKWNDVMPNGRSGAGYACPVAARSSGVWTGAFSTDPSARNERVHNFADAFAKTTG